MRGARCVVARRGLERRVLIIALGALLTAPLAGQVPPARNAFSGTASVIGRVVDVDSGQPVPGTSVVIMPSTGPRGGLAVRTDPRGRFFFGLMKAGRYIVSTSTDRREIELTDNTQIPDVLLTSWRPATVSGRVTDEAGDPVPGMTVTAVITLPEAPVPTTTIGTATTDDRGRYTLSAMTHGDVLVCACGWKTSHIDGALLNLLATLGPATGTAPESDDNVRSVMPTFYPSARSAALATPLVLGSGQSRDGIDIVVARRRGARVSGHVTAGAAQIDATSIRLRRVDPTDASVVPDVRPWRVHPDGRFEFHAVPEGEYELQLRLQTADLFANVPLSVGGTDLTGLVVAATPMPPVTGRVVLKESMASFEAQRQNIFMHSIDGRMPRLSLSARPTADGNFEFTDVVPGRYRVMSAAGANGPFLSSVRLGDHELPGGALTVGTGPIANLVVVLTAEPRAQLALSVAADADTLSTPTQLAWVFPQDQQWWDAGPMAVDRVRQTNVSAYGPSMVALPAGAYFVALAPASQLPLDSRAFFSRLAQTATPVVLQPGDNPPLTVRRR